MFILFPIYNCVYCQNGKLIDYNYIQKNLNDQNQVNKLVKNDPTIIFWLRDFGCTQCVMASVKINVSQITNNSRSNDSIDKINLMTVIDTDSPEDAKVYKRKAYTNIFFLDNEHYFYNNFIRSDKTINNLISNAILIFNKSGNLIYKKYDFQIAHNFNLNHLIDSINLLSNVSKNISIKHYHSLPLIENDSIIITDIEEYYFDRNLSKLFLLDRTLNRIIEYSYLDGTEKRIISPPLDLKFYFANTKDTIEKKIWNKLDSMFDEMVHFEHLMIINQDTLAVLEMYENIVNDL
jgi:hypothetical protein